MERTEVAAMAKWMLIVMVVLLFAGADVNEARADSSPQISISPSSGACDAPVTISASGLGSEFVFFMVGPEGAEPQLPAYDVLYAGQSPDGAIAFTPKALWWPSLCEEFAHPTLRVIATLTPGVADGTLATIAAEATFTKTAEIAAATGPRITLDPASGTCDAPITVRGTGFRPDATMQIGVSPLVILPGNGGAGFVDESLAAVGADGAFTHVLHSPMFQNRCTQYFSPRVSIRADEAKGVSGSVPGPLVAAVFHRSRQLNGGGLISVGPTPVPAATGPTRVVHNVATIVPSAAAASGGDSNSDDGNQAIEVAITVLGALAAAAAAMFVAQRK